MSGGMDERTSRFMELYEQRINTEWIDYYVNFRGLLNDLESFIERFPDASDARKKAFVKKYARKLSFQIERVNYFATTQAGEISSLLNVNLMRTKESFGRLSDTSLRERFELSGPETRLEIVRGLHADFTELGGEIKELMKYLDSNLSAIQELRTIVMSVLGDVRAFPNITQLIERQIAGRNTAFDQGNLLDALNRLPIESSQDVETLLMDRERRSAEISLSSSQYHLRILRKCDHIKFIAGFINTLARALDRLSIAEEGLLLKMNEQNGTSEPQNEQPMELGTLRRSGDRLIRLLISMKNSHVNRALTVQRLISAESGVFMEDTLDDPVEEEFRSQLPKVNMWLNLLSTLLYLISMYAPLSTAGEYAKMLGVSKQWFGFILASTPFAGFISAPLWSWAANESFKTPLIVSSMVCLVGNIIYALAQSYSSIRIAILGRILVGFGGARAVNRRYIADNVSRSDQPIQSYYFVVASALGMPLGPFLSIFANIPPDFEQPLPGLSTTLFFNDYTNCAWVLAGIWITYIFFLSKYFVEPHRPSAPVDGINRRATGSVQEKTPLVDVNADKTNKYDEPTFRVQMKGLVKNPVIVFLLFLYFVIKLACEIAISGAAFYLPHIYKWSSFSTSVYLTVLGILMVLITPIVRKLLESNESDASDDGPDKDRNVLAPSLVLACIGCCLGLPLFGHAQVSIQVLLLVTATTIIFVSTNAAESCTMSVLRRSSPPELLNGMWNTSLLATISGMMGRAAADVIIYFAGDAKSEQVQLKPEFFKESGTLGFFWVAFLPSVATCVFCLLGMWSYWSTMSSIRSSAVQETEIRNAVHRQGPHAMRDYGDETDDYAYARSSFDA